MPDTLLQPIFVLLWSSGYVVGALASQVSGPVPLLATRFILASLVTVPAALHTGGFRGAPLRRLAVIGLLFQVVQFGGIYGGFALGVPAGLSALVMLGLAPLVTTGLAIAGGQEAHDWRVWSGLIIGIAGVAIGLTPELGHARIGAGLVVTAVGMLGLAGGSVLQKRWGAGVDPIGVGGHPVADRRGGARPGAGDRRRALRGGATARALTGLAGGRHGHGHAAGARQPARPPRRQPRDRAAAARTRGHRDRLGPGAGRAAAPGHGRRDGGVRRRRLGGYP